jgi:hypothetical protein
MLMPTLILFGIAMRWWEVQHLLIVARCFLAILCLVLLVRMEFGGYTVLILRDAPPQEREKTCDRPNGRARQSVSAAEIACGITVILIYF